MTFSKEDKAAWYDSEIMQHLERIAREQDILNGPPQEAYQPISTNEETEEEDIKIWEDDDSIPDKNEITDELVREEDLKEELEKIYSNTLIEKLTKISSLLASNSQIQAAYKIERTLDNIKILLED